MSSRNRRIKTAAIHPSLAPLYDGDGVLVGALGRELRAQLPIEGRDVEVEVTYYGADKRPRVRSVRTSDPNDVLPEVLNLPRLARDVVVRAASTALVHKGGGVMEGTEDAALRWQLVGAVLLGTKAYAATDDEVLTAWRSGLEAGALAGDIAASLGLSPSRLRGRLDDLRAERGEAEVPRGKAGRRSTTEIHKSAAGATTRKA